jgi:hypothetical protein
MAVIPPKLQLVLYNDVYKTMKNILNRIMSFLGSRRFFILILAFFIFEAIWIVLSAVYPQAFDEDFHFGLIKVYSHYWLPFLSRQPPHANAYGAVARDPSYLYHYLMSFPYRFIALFVHSQTLQIIILRIINVGLFSSGLILFRRVLLRAKLSPSLTNVSLAIFTLIPVAPQLAAHINYDNLLFPLTAGTCLLTFRVVDEIRRRKPSLRSLLILATVCFFSSQVKYAFVPIFVAVTLFLAYCIYRAYKGNFKALFAALRTGWHKQSKLVKVVLVGLFLISVSVFAQRDGVNLVEYHTFTPNCSTVLNVTSCSAYGPWEYSYTTHLSAVAHKQSISYTNPVYYVGIWAYWMWYRLFFAVNGPSSGYTNYPPLPVISAASAIVGIGGLVAVVVWRHRIFRGNPYIAFFFVASVLYLLALLLDGYAQYRYTDQLLTMNGRYLLPILLLVAAIMGRAFSIALSNSPTRKIVLSVVVLVLFLQGGGFLTFLSRSDSSWDWPNSTVVKVNNAARKVTGKVIVKGKNTYSTTVWFFN